MGMHNRHWQRDRQSQRAHPEQQPIARPPIKRRKSLTFAQLLWLSVLFFASLLAWNALQDIKDLQTLGSETSAQEDSLQPQPSHALTVELFSTTASIASLPSELHECLQNDTPQPEPITRCRPETAPPNTGVSLSSQDLVSRGSIARPESTSASRSSAVLESEQHWVKKSSSEESYLAAWNIIDNRIDDLSVCGNYRKGSTDYQECRQGAKQYFKQKCQAWRSRHEQDEENKSKWLEERYCSAGNDFNPMG
jgi:hypothetical protein